MGSGFELVRDIVKAHYHLTERGDTEFWRYCGNMTVPDSLRFGIESFRKHGHVFVQPGEVFAPQPSMTLMYSQGVVPESYPPFTDTLDDQAMRTKLSKIRAEDQARGRPDAPPREFHRQSVRGGPDRQLGRHHSPIGASPLAPISGGVAKLRHWC